MGRYDSTQSETYIIDVSKNKGFPYEFPFVFDRTENRDITQPNETWSTDVAKTGRYGSA